MQACPKALLEWQRLKLPVSLKKDNNFHSKAQSINGCSRCGRNSHSVKDCFAKTTAHGQVFQYSESESSTYLEEDACYRCGRTGHFVRDCFAKTDINGFYFK